MESSGNAENWQSSQINMAVGEMVDGFDFLSEQAQSRNVNLSWVYEVNASVPTSLSRFKNITCPTMICFRSSLGVQMDQRCSQLLQLFRDKWDGAFDMANDMRRVYHANWAFSVFVVMDENDADHMFPDDGDWFAYVPHYFTYPGSPSSPVSW